MAGEKEYGSDIDQAKNKARDMLYNSRRNPEKGEFVVSPEENIVNYLVKRGMSKGDANYFMAQELYDIAESPGSVVGYGVMTNPSRLGDKFLEMAAEEGNENAIKLAEKKGIKARDVRGKEGIPIGVSGRGKAIEDLVTGGRKYHTIIFAVMSGAGLFVLSANLTGNVILNLSQTSSNVLGALLFAAGITGLFFSFRKSKVKKE